jgi:hypothetical protein
MNPVQKTLTILCVTILFVQCSTEPTNKQEMEESNKEDCCANESSTKNSETSEITCPECGHTSLEILPTSVCQIKYTCENCSSELTPKEGDCCVFCTYGTHKCPSMQDEE